MTVQMTVRLPDSLAAFVDQRVAEGEGSRASVIANALERERRRREIEHEIAVIDAVHARGEQLYPDLDGWVRSADFTDVDNT
jgi:Arc/MetJ-type ribon-helix-helix transcriptional regulator